MIRVFPSVLFKHDKRTTDTKLNPETYAMAPITDQEWTDLVEHELPQHSDPVIQRYLESRGALMAQNQKRHSGNTSTFFTSPTQRASTELRFSAKPTRSY